MPQIKHRVMFFTKAMTSRPQIGYDFAMIRIEATTALTFLARLLLVSYFLQAGLKNLLKPIPLFEMIKRKNIPLAALALVSVFAIQILGSLMILFNWYASIGALGLIGFTIASNLLFCNFWRMEGMQKQLTHFLFSANLAIIGGLLLVTLMPN